MRVHLRAGSNAEHFSEDFLKIGDKKNQETEGKIILSPRLGKVVSNNLKKYYSKNIYLF